MNPTIAKRTIQAIVMPLFILFLQLFFKVLFNKEITTVGISLASIGIAQIFPYMFWDNLILLKVTTLLPTSEKDSGVLKLGYNFTVTKGMDQINTLKNLTMLMFIVILTLFILTLGMGYKPEYYSYHNISGTFCALLSIGYVIYA